MDSTKRNIEIDTSDTDDEIQKDISGHNQGYRGLEGSITWTKRTKSSQMGYCREYGQEDQEGEKERYDDEEERKKIMMRNCKNVIGRI